MEYRELLQQYRDQIDTIDQEMIYLLSRRLQIVEQVWILKKEHNVAPLQPDRWQEVLLRLYEEADARMLSRELIDDIWNRIHTEALRIEKR